MKRPPYTRRALSLLRSVFSSSAKSFPSAVVSSSTPSAYITLSIVPDYFTESIQILETITDIGAEPFGCTSTWVMIVDEVIPAFEVEVLIQIDSQDKIATKPSYR